MKDASKIYLNDFLQSIEAEKTARVVNSILGNLPDVNIEEYDFAELENLIVELKPNSPKAITTDIYVLTLYAKWLYDTGRTDNDDLYQKLQSLDRNLIWIKAKPQAKKKFIAHDVYTDLLDDIEKEDLNGFYYRVLFQCVYEGIYNDDISVIKNLRASDIHGNIVTLRPDDGESYDLEISDKLAEDLKDIAREEIWERKNRYGVCKVEMVGKHFDSCFKIERRKTTDTSSDSYRFSYYSKLRKISKDYVGYNLLPLQLFISGIMYRIKQDLENNGIDINEAFSNDNRSKVVSSIISNETERCNYNIEVRNFKEMVKGHLDVFG